MTCTYASHPFLFEEFKMGELGFYLFGHFIAYYGLMIVAGIAVGSAFAGIQLKRFRLGMNDLIILVSVCGLCGILGAKLLYLIVSFKEIDFSRLSDLSYLAALMSGGFVFLGGAIGILPGLFFCKKILNISVQPYLQSCMGCLPIGHAFGRVGCFLAGCCYGRPYHGHFSVTYTKSLYAPNGIALFPVQLAEALAEFLLGLCLLALSRKLRGTASVWLYLLVYSMIRFFLEFMRYDEARGSIGVISTSQLLSIVLLVFSSLLLIKELRNPALSRG